MAAIKTLNQRWRRGATRCRNSLQNLHLAPPWARLRPAPLFLLHLHLHLGPARGGPRARYSLCALGVHGWGYNRVGSMVVHVNNPLSGSALWWQVSYRVGHSLITGMSALARVPLAHLKA